MTGVDWTQARCGDDPDFMHVAGLIEGQVAYARRVCGTCPIRTACLQRALDMGEYRGVWGGMTGRERRALAGQRQIPQPLRHDLIVHVQAGTEPFSALTLPEQVWLWRRHQTSGESDSAFVRRYRVSGTTMRQVQAADALNESTPQRQHALAA